MTSDSGPSPLAFSVSRSPTQRLTCHLRIYDGANDAFFEHHFGIYAYDVSQFLLDLEQLHARMDGVAKLKGVYYEEAGLLSVSVADSGSGRLVFSGEIIPQPDDDFPTSQLGGVLPFSGVRFQFDGLAADQSFIPPFVAQMNRFFREAEIDTSPY